ncbi:2'-5' RNA ligase family protein [Streptomyces coeruleorubidus]|uniref:2'-5' RNA ligase family protein n=1 Tax=Streptomyces coeruleorubidus TaxID=116188 RepID=UPI00237F58E9|nr:2'-5' RNA ligase family protein [Streptomyces coeruleorubidus]WDV56474.1 2'-5' RNA ligase family protein [Streptomyces coeruleorubidus]
MTVTSNHTAVSPAVEATSTEPTGRFAQAPGDPYRYGVYLRPDPATCAAVTAVTSQLRAQYGVVSAGAFPPHATLAGSRHITAPIEEIIAAVTRGLAEASAFTVHNAGIRRQGAGLVYDVHHLADGITPNTSFTDLAALVDEAVVPLETPAPNPAEDRFAADTFRAHLSLVSHDMDVRPDLSEELEEYVRALPVSFPQSFPADAVALYRTRSDDWSGRWWQTLTWEHLHTWRLPR